MLVICTMQVNSLYLLIFLHRAEVNFSLVVQRFANASYFKRSVLEQIAADMLTLQVREQQPLDARLGSFLRLPPSSAAADIERSAKPSPNTLKRS